MLNKIESAESLDLSDCESKSQAANSVARRVETRKPTMQTCTHEHN